MVHVIESAAVDENLLQTHLFGVLYVAVSRALGGPPSLGGGVFLLSFNSFWRWLCWLSVSKEKKRKVTNPMLRHDMPVHELLEMPHGCC
jgi:hypothetical protein